ERLAAEGREGVPERDLGLLEQAALLVEVLGLRRQARLGLRSPLLLGGEISTEADHLLRALGELAAALDLQRLQLLDAGVQLPPPGAGAGVEVRACDQPGEYRAQDEADRHQR